MPLDIDSDEIKEWTIEQLAKRRDDLSNNSPNAVLIDNEIDRRRREQQHELNLIILDRQTKANRRTTYISIIGTVIATIVGIIVGKFL